MASVPEGADALPQALADLLAYRTDVPQYPRQTGEVSIKHGKLL